MFDEDLVRHYQAYLDRRRQLRPGEEYRPATDTEWVEFEAHFDKRKVELGNCGRPYGTGCTHEHACLRCPMLQVQSDMLPRLDIIETDLLDRRSRAEAENWLGEIEGIDLTLRHLTEKRRHGRPRAATPHPPKRSRPGHGRLRREAAMTSRTITILVAGIAGVLLLCVAGPVVLLGGSIADVCPHTTTSSSSTTASGQSLAWDRDQVANANTIIAVGAQRGHTIPRVGHRPRHRHAGVRSTEPAGR